MEPMMYLAVVFAVLNTIVLLALLVVYGRIALKSKAAHSIGLVIFDVFLLAQNLTTVFAYISMEQFFEPAALPALSGISGFEFVGLLVLAKITF
ncbi:MAG: hypothetical protein JRN20_01915 [Nitrososphaerota archaeon]|nr:hypothetical protein [Nitrososphaerota archaeon]MDG6922847.1 hypothetical protein [Nitrososphaerota archaeon]